jgi:hypothetical protein
MASGSAKNHGRFHKNEASPVLATIQKEEAQIIAQRISPIVTVAATSRPFATRATVPPTNSETIRCEINNPLSTHK